MSPESKIAALKDRAHLFQEVRSFFSLRNVLEVDTPILSKTAPIDEHIDIMTASPFINTKGYLHSSPEYAMKRLLALGSGDIFQMSHVFRQGELGKNHNVEFMMVEWYRIGMSFTPFIEETAEFMRLFLGPLPLKTLSYKEAFLHFTGINYLTANTEDLLLVAKKNGIELSSTSSWNKEDLLHLLMGSLIEPHLGKEELLALIDYPASQAALAQKEEKNGEIVAKRFEIYYKGIELANGYLELSDPLEQRLRLLESSDLRKAQGKEDLPLDENFLKALQQGIPPCCGVAAGFDRLLMLRRKAASLEEVIPFSWNEL